MTSFITSKKGHINKLTLFNYKLTDAIINEKEQCSKFKHWLTKSDDIQLYEINDHDFTTFQAMEKESSNQYFFDSSKEINAPFENVQQISGYISSLIRLAFNKKYKRFLNENIYVTDTINISPFVLKKVIEFNIELFSNGEFFLHFLPSTKITSQDNISVQYIHDLKTSFLHPMDDVEFFLIENKRFKKLKIELFSKGLIKTSYDFINEHKSVIATFNYHFISKCTPEVFGKIVKETTKDLDKSILYLQDKLKNISFDNLFNFQEKLFYRINIQSLGNNNNLLIGSNKSVNKQSAAYHNGIFKPANNCVILPILADGYKSSNFKELVNRFNKNSNMFDLLEPLYMDSSNKSAIEDLTTIRHKYKKKILAAIFTEYKLSNDFIESLKKTHIPFQIYSGLSDIYKLSNFTIKCLEKLGGNLSVINNSEETENTYFIGIDLGHSRNSRGKFSNLALTFFDYKGVFIHSYVNKDLPRNEALSSEIINPCFRSFLRHITKNNLPIPKKIIIHRDGKMHNNDIKNIIEQSNKQLNVSDVEILEIIKQGYPVFANFEEQFGAYMNPSSGDFFLFRDYAILITNIQADEKNSIVNPIIVRHKFGVDNMEKLVKQVYWFTKMYTNNLYNSTRLPATTLKANNIVGTSLKLHQATYKG